jgi:hypothetical protein
MFAPNRTGGIVLVISELWFSAVGRDCPPDGVASSAYPMDERGNFNAIGQ